MNWYVLIAIVAVMFVVLFYMSSGASAQDAGKIAGNNTGGSAFDKLRAAPHQEIEGGGAETSGGVGNFGEIWS